MNERLAYRPLLGGTGIVASNEGRWATLGLIASNAGQRFGVTALHALGNLAPNSTVTIAQGPWREAGIAIATMAAQQIRGAAALDVAAFPIDAGIQSSNEILGLGPWTTPSRAPVVGETVVKVGAKTGLTIGRVVAVNGASAEIGRLPNYPPMYALGDTGDSGAVWLSYPTLVPLVIHRELRLANGRAIGTVVVNALAALNLVL